MKELVAKLISSRLGGLLTVWLTPLLVAAWASLAQFSPDAAKKIKPEEAASFVSAIVVSGLVWALRKDWKQQREAIKTIQRTVNDSSSPVTVNVTGSARPNGTTVAAVKRIVKEHAAARVAANPNRKG